MTWPKTWSMGTGPMKRLSAKDLHRFTHVDHDARVAFVVLLGDQVIGVGR